MNSYRNEKLVWVFGASGVLGREITHQLLSENSRVIAFVHSTPQAIEHLADSPLLKIIQLDLRDFEGVNALIESLIEGEQSPNAVYFCARGKVILDESLRVAKSLNAEFIDDYLIAVLTPTVITLKLIDKASHLRRIVFLSSQYALVAQDKSLYTDPESSLSAIYSALRGAVISVVRALAIRAIDKGISINVFSLGGIKESTNEELAQKIEKIVPLKRMLTADEAAKAIIEISEVFELGMVGNNIVIDGGWTIL